MKKIINGKVYDTTTATEVGCDGNGLSLRDFNFVSETLYRKRTGEYFLYAHGGAMTRYAVRCGDMWGDGQHIIPLGYDKAKEWAEKHLTASEYEAEFGKVAEDDSTTTLTFSLPADLAERIRMEARQAGMGLSAYIITKF